MNDGDHTQRDRQARDIFLRAIEIESEEARAAYLEGACGNEHSLRSRVDALIESNKNDSFLESAAVDASATEFEGAPTFIDETKIEEGAGSQIDRYKLLQKLGEGGFGVVYMAEQKEPVKRRIALKIIKLGMDTKQVVARFEAERQALAMMDHPNIAKVLDAGSTETGRPYFVMELVKGVAITKYCDDNNLTTKERLDLFIPVCQAIQHAHQKGIIHRDIKPSNVMVTLHDGLPVPKVIDFGIAKATQQELTEKTIFTQYSQFIGTPAYMSPEQAEMSGLDIDTRSDIYSLGVLLYELLVGKTPLDGKELMSGGYDEIRRRIKEEEPAKPSTRVNTMVGSEKTTVAKHRKIGPDQLSSELRGDLDWIVLKALEKDRTRRYETANGFVLDIKRFLENEPVSAVPPSKGYLFKKYVRRNKTPLAVAATIVGLLVAGIAASTWQAIRATRAQKVAETAEAAQEQQRLLAQEKKEEADTLRQEAVDSERKQRLRAYATDMSLAHRYLSENKLAAVKQILDRWAGPENDGFRGIYWGHLAQATSRDKSQTLPHDSMVRSVSFSREGTWLASQTLSGRIRLYDTRSRELHFEYGGGLLAHGAREGSVAISPDGRLLAADQQGTLKVWDTTTEELVFEQQHVVAPIAFTPDSKSLVGVAATGIQMWNTSDWATTDSVERLSSIDTTQAVALTFTPDGKRLICSPSRFGSAIVIYNLETRSVEGELTGLDRPAVISTDGKTVAAGGWNGYVAVWKLEQRDLLKHFKAHTSIVLGVSLSPDGQVLATGGNDGIINLWSTDNFNVIGKLMGHRSQVWNLKFSENGRKLASAGMDQSVKLWDWQAALDQAASAAQKIKLAASSDTATAPDKPLPRGTPKTHIVQSGESIQSAINAANPGDRIEIAQGVHPIAEPIVVNKPLIIAGAPGSSLNQTFPTRLETLPGVEAVMLIDTKTKEDLLIQDLQMESFANGIRHQTGDFKLQRCRVTTRSTLDFHTVIGLGAVTPGNRDDYSLEFIECALTAEYAGNTIEGTPPDIDVIATEAGTRHDQIIIRNCGITNHIPNTIANGIETRASTACVSITDNEVQSMGIGIVIPNHHGTVEIRDNTIQSSFVGITVGGNSREPNYITGNRITVENEELELYPFFVRNYIDAQGSSCIAIGHTSAGVTAGFFLQEVIGFATNFKVENNTLAGNPKAGISMNDSSDPENYGPYTPNTSHNNVIAQNDFTRLKAERPLVLGPSTFDNQIYGNPGLKDVFKEAGKRDRNQVSLTTSSPPRYIGDTIVSPALEGNLLGDPAERSMWVWLPPGYDSSPEKRYPVVYLLHGFTGDHNQFKNGPMLGLNISEMAGSLIAAGSIDDVIIVMPDASNAYGGSFYGSNEVIGDYQSYIARDLVNYIDETYRTISDRSHRSIAGNSMGANGAITLAMKFSETFGAIAAMSPSSDFSIPPTFLDKFIATNPETLGDPTRVHNTEELRALLSGNVMVNLLYGFAAAYSPNPNKPPYFVDLPLRYPEKRVVEEVWNRWLDQDLVSQLERNGQNLKNTDVFIDIGGGPTTIMPEGHDIDHLRAALDKQGIAYTFVESPGDHLSHLRVRTIETLKFLSSPETYSASQN